MDPKNSVGKSDEHKIVIWPEQKKAAGLKFIRNQILSNNEYHHKATRVFLMSLVSLVETLVSLVETLVSLVETLVSPVKTLVETLVSLVETLVETLVSLLETFVESSS